MGHTFDNTESQQPHLDCHFAEAKDLSSYTMKWDDISLKLYLEYNSAASLARERAMYTTMGRKISDEQLNAELTEIKKTAEDTMDSIWKVLAENNVFLFVEVTKPNGEKKKMCMTVREFDQFCKTISRGDKILFWPSHFKSHGETSEYVTDKLEQMAR